MCVRLCLWVCVVSQSQVQSKCWLTYKWLPSLLTPATFPPQSLSSSKGRRCFSYWFGNIGKYLGIRRYRRNKGSDVFTPQVYLSKEGGPHSVAPLLLWIPAEEMQSRGEYREGREKPQVAPNVNDSTCSLQDFKGYQAELRGATIFLYQDELQETVKKCDSFKMR